MEYIKVGVLHQLVTCCACLQGPEVLIVRQRLEAQYDSELRQAKER